MEYGEVWPRRGRPLGLYGRWKCAGFGVFYSCPGEAGEDIKFPHNCWTRTAAPIITSAHSPVEDQRSFVSFWRDTWKLQFCFFLFGVCVFLLLLA